MSSISRLTRFVSSYQILKVSLLQTLTTQLAQTEQSALNEQQEVKTENQQLKQQLESSRSELDSARTELQQLRAQVEQLKSGVGKAKERVAHVLANIPGGVTQGEV